MSNQIPTAFVNEYKSNITLLLQQMGSKLDGTVMMESQNSEFKFFDRVAQVAADEITTRHGNTEYVNTPHDRRRNGLRHFDVADLIDRKDKLQMLADPTNPYARSQAMALGRRKDDSIIEAFFANAASGKDGSTAVPFPAAQQINVAYVESGAAANSGLTIAKLRRALNLLESAEVDVVAEVPTIVVSPNEKQSLLQTTEITSADFNTVRALVNGQIDTFMGFKFITSNRLQTKTAPSDAGGNANSRRIPVYVKSGMLLGMADDITVEIDRLPTKRYSVQVYAAGSWGSTRMEEGRVVEIECLV